MAVTLQQDPFNANKGTVRGAALLKASLLVCGAGRSIVTDKHGTVLGGNKTLATAQALGIPTETVETDGHELVVVQRTDLDLAVDATARQLAYYDNRTHELDLAWDRSQVAADVLAGVDVGAAFFPKELTALTVTPGASKLEPPVLDLPQTDGGAMPDVPLTPAPVVAPTIPVLRITLTFATLDAHARWQAFMAALAARYPEVTGETALLDRHLS
jgi:hypothetical protein